MLSNFGSVGLIPCKRASQEHTFVRHGCCCGCCCGALVCEKIRVVMVAGNTGGVDAVCMHGCVCGVRGVDYWEDEEGDDEW